MSWTAIPDEIEDQPIDGPLVATVDAPLSVSQLVIGGGVLSNQYNTDDHLESTVPLRVVRLAFRYGIRTIDTSIYYGPSELVLGKALQAIKEEFPRSSYQIMTKCGRVSANEFNYHPDAIRDSVKRSLERLQTDYLDTVYLHDTEFVCTPVGHAPGDSSAALKDKMADFGLAHGQESKVHGDGDQQILDAFATLRELKEQGIIKKIGITGYPLPTLLRLALLILHNPPYEPVDVILSYSHLSLQNSTFLQFGPELLGRAKVGQLLTASPFSMGLLTAALPPWHPSPEPLRQAAAKARAEVDGLPNVALGYAIRKCGGVYPLVTGFSKMSEVHECVGVWREIMAGGKESEGRLEKEEKVMGIFEESGFKDWSWASP
ncbi:Aldo/keto reductase [Hymenopellis radicata]|nr:Aldo/keto reductase [Hymenopellis radicata]